MTDQNTPLSPRHERFVLEFLMRGNATQAYIRAGYAPRGAQPSASRLLRKPHIAAAIAAGQRRVANALELSVARIGREYARIAFANVDDYVQIEKDGRPRIDLDKASRAQRAGIVEMKVSNHRKPEQLVTLKLNKLQALAALTDRMGLFAKQPELTSADRARYEHAIAKLGEDWRRTMIRLIEAEAERDEARAALAEAQLAKAQAKRAAAMPNPSPSGPSAAPDLRGEKEDHSNPCAMAAPEAPPLRTFPPPLSQPVRPSPYVAGAGRRAISWNTARQPPPGLTRRQVAGTIANHGNRDPPATRHWRGAPAIGGRGSAGRRRRGTRLALAEFGEAQLAVLVGVAPHERLVGPRDEVGPADGALLGIAGALVATAGAHLLGRELAVLVGVEAIEQGSARGLHLGAVDEAVLVGIGAIERRLGATLAAGGVGRAGRGLGERGQRDEAGDEGGGGDATGAHPA